MTDRIRAAFDACRSRGEKAMGLFLTNGFPAPAATLPILRAVDEAGADFIELGMPFSDPLAEGLPIQHASERALAHGVTMPDAFRTAEAFRRESETPLLLMGYVNPILRYGVGAFCREAAAAGVDGLILPDLPPEEADMIQSEADDAGLGLVFLVAPNTADERVRLVDRRASAFVYAVSVAGLTGTEIGGLDGISTYLQRVRGLVDNNPLCVGFGIRDHADAERLSRHTDGFIVGSALIRRVEQLWDDASLSPEERLARLRHWTSELKHGPTVSQA
jgi:tryptophan synthase alpha chain